MKNPILSISFFLLIFFSFNTSKAQSPYNMCSASAPTIFAPLTGSFYDSGGPSGNYADNQNCTVLFQAPAGGTITMNFSMFASEASWDYMQIYDGINISGIPLHPTTGGSGFSGYGPGYNGTVSAFSVTALSGKMFVQWRSDASVTEAGWAATWVMTNPSSGAILPPIANFFPSQATTSSVPTDTVWINSPYDLVSTSTSTTRSYWDLQGENPLNPGYARYNVAFTSQQYIDTAKYSQRFRYTFNRRGFWPVRLLAINAYKRDSLRDSIVKYIWV
ncbi:MAG: CUB domain-containing protein, partial [Bacteroidota bacterium]|nr:CUB domain-containing protein [Bacteroidota bacterium]